MLVYWEFAKSFLSRCRMQSKAQEAKSLPQCLSLPWKQLVSSCFQPSMHSTMQLPTPQTFPTHPFGLPSCCRGHTSGAPSLLPLCFCHLVRRATHHFPQGPNKGASAWPRAPSSSSPPPHKGRAWKTALCSYCGFSGTSIWVNGEAHLTPRQENPYFYFFQLLLSVSSVP